MKRLAVLWLLAGCAKSPAPIHLHDRLDANGDDVPDSGAWLSSAALTLGEKVYRRDCGVCHGEQGRGDGPSAFSMRPPPRNFVDGQYKFSGTGYGDLPCDAQLERTITRGLTGTAMLGWSLPPDELRAVIAYLKSLSPRWQEDGVKPELEISADPFRDGGSADAIALGRRVYHLARGGAGCNGCHPSLESSAVLAAIAEDAGVPDTATRGNALTPKDSSYPAGAQALKVLPPRIGLDPVKTSPPLGPHHTRADQREDLYRVIATGVGGAAMPGWKGVLEEPQLWALAYYLQAQLGVTP